MDNNGWTGLIYRITVWVMRLAYVNIIWILFSLAGLIIFGLFPATVGLYAVTRQWLLKDIETVPVWKTFWKAYRSEFITANFIGYVFLIFGLIIFTNLNFLQSHTSLIFLVLSFIFWFIFIIYWIMWLFLFPIFVHYELKFLQYFKQTLLIVILRPLEVILSIIGFVSIYFLFLYIPMLFLFFGMSVFAFITMWLAHRAFRKLHLKAKSQKQKEVSW